MIHSPQRKEPDFRWMLVCSSFIHLSCYFLLFIFHFAPKPFKEGPVYYVDIVNLPVANPQAGAPSTSGSPPAVPARQEMTLPQKTAGKTTLKTIPSRKETPSVETERQFEERMAKIARTVDARHVSAALDELQKKVGAGGKSGQAGMPGAKGTEAGSDYAAYIRSRLTDAFAKTIAYQTKSPTVLVSITIDRNGRVIALKIEKSSADRLFEDSVRRAILKAEQTFPPPPGGATFEYSYRFAPEGVSKK